MKKAGLFILTLGFLSGCGQTNKTMTTQSAEGAPGASSSQVTLNWTSNLGEQQGFDIEESTDGVNFSQIQTVPDGTNVANIPVSPNQKYFFRIRSYNQAGFSPYSATLTRN